MWMKFYIIHNIPKNYIKLYAVPIVYNDGKLVGNFSATDLKHMYRNESPCLNMTVYSPSSIYYQGLFKDYTTLGMVLKHFNHRVWLVDEGKISYRSNGLYYKL